MKREFEYIVLGLGGIGSGALYWLARQAGGEVLGLEQFAIGHGRGGSQDHSRIIRLSYHTPGYVELAKAAYKWTRRRSDLGRITHSNWRADLFRPTRPSPAATAWASSGRRRRALRVAKRRGGQVARWPQFRLTDDAGALPGVWESGIAPAGAQRGPISQRSSTER
ncbi:MAG: hypothetical protein H6661_02455 [Ardenticatenaceae bacterium]|nr:hypothetical protein [Ardenticatenaceae bacterium]